MRTLKAPPMKPVTASEVIWSGGSVSPRNLDGGGMSFNGWSGQYTTTTTEKALALTPSAYKPLLSTLKYVCPK